MPPLLPWEAPNDAAHSQLVWRSKLDDRYLIEVHSVNDYQGTLRIFDHDKNDEEIASWDVSLENNAIFGPDVADVSDWQDKVADFIDNTYGKQK